MPSQRLRLLGLPKSVLASMRRSEGLGPAEAGAVYQERVDTEYSSSRVVGTLGKLTMNDPNDQDDSEEEIYANSLFLLYEGVKDTCRSG